MSLRVGLKAAGFVIVLSALCSLAPSAIAVADTELWKRRVIYLVMPDRFHNGDSRNDRLGSPECHNPARPDKFHGGDLTGVRQKLDYLGALGVTTIWITPVYKQVPSVRALGDSPYGDCGYHGYWSDFTDPPTAAMEPKLGTAADLLALIADVHARKMRFILDMVVNHAGYGANIVKQHPDWFHDAITCAVLGDRDVFCPLFDLPDFKQELENDVVTDYLVSESTGWVRRFAIDGIRMDTASHVPPEFFRDRWIPAINRARTGLFLLAEASPARSLPQLRPFMAEYGFDSVFNFPLRRALVDVFAKGQSVDVLADAVQQTISTMGQDRATMLVNLLDNHDTPRFVSEPTPDLADVDIRRKYLLALAALFTLPGIPQLYYGDELGLYGRGDPDNRRDMPEWAWTHVGRAQAHPREALPRSEVIFNHVQKLIRIRTGNSGLYQGYYAEVRRQHNGTSVYAFFRSDAHNRIFTVINNGDLPSNTIVMPIAANGAITRSDRDALPDGTILEDILNERASVATLSDGQFTVDLPANTAMIYRPKTNGGASAVAFRVTATTTPGEGVYLSGDAMELGTWNPGSAVRMRPTRCSGDRCRWSVTLRYIPHGKSVKFKYLKKSGSTTVWEGGNDRLLSVPSVATSVYEGGEWRQTTAPR